MSRRNGSVSPVPTTTVSSSIVSGNKNIVTGGAGADVNNDGKANVVSGGYNLIGTGNATGAFTATPVGAKGP